MYSLFYGDFLACFSTVGEQYAPICTISQLFNDLITIHCVRSKVFCYTVTSLLIMLVFRSVDIYHIIAACLSKVSRRKSIVMIWLHLVQHYVIQLNMEISLLHLSITSVNLKQYIHIFEKLYIKTKSVKHIYIVHVHATIFV